MKDPGPNVLEQQIETNRLLALLLAAAACPPELDASSPGIYGGGRCQWPVLFSWCDEGQVPFIYTGSDGFSVGTAYGDTQSLSHSSAIKMHCPANTTDHVEMNLGIPMPESLCPRVQLACMFKSEAPTFNLKVELEYVDGYNRLRAGMMVHTQHGSLQYLKSNGLYEIKDNYAFDDEDCDWSHLDLSVNFATKKYSYIACNASGHDMSAVGIEIGGAANRRQLNLQIIVYNDSGSNPIDAYIDEILVTDHLYTGPGE